MNHRAPVETLTDEEAATIRALIKRDGVDIVMQELGLAKRTVLKAAAEAPVSRLTANLIRARLAQ
jgi:hypothetical protein